MNRTKHLPAMARWTALAVCIAMLASSAKAGDLPTARQQLEKVRMDVQNASWDSFDNDVKSTQASLDGLPDTDRLPIQKEIDDLKSRAAPAIRDYRASLVTKNIESAGPIVKQLDDAMAAQPFKDARTSDEVARVQQSLNALRNRINTALAGAPPDDPRVVEINRKLNGYDGVITAQVNAAGASEAADKLARQWASLKENFTGWDDEKDCPTWKQWVQGNTESIGNLDLSKTMQLVVRVGPWLNDDSVKAISRQYPDNTSIQATTTEARMMYDAAALKMNENFDKVMSEAEGIPNPTPSDRQGIARLARRVDDWFGTTAYHDANAARAKALADRWNNSSTGALALRQAALQKRTTDASARWPAIAASIRAVDGFTPAKAAEFKGKIIHLKGNNRLGYEFQPGEYSYACSIDGMPVAGKFDPPVQAAVDDALNAIPPDQFPDENWDAYAVVEGPGKIQVRKPVEGEARIGSEKIGSEKIGSEKTGAIHPEEQSAVNCAVVKIFALHAGPVAVGSNGQGGAVIGAPAGLATTTPPVVETGSAFSILALLEHLVEFAICVSAGCLVVLKVSPAVATDADVPPTALPGHGQIEMIGMGFLAIGLLWLVGKLILGDLLPAGSLALCGLILSGNWFTDKGLLPASLAGLLKTFAIPIAGACVLFGLLHLFLAHWYLF